jgi:5-carboxyvanillate decarboxylase
MGAEHLAQEGIMNQRSLNVLLPQAGYRRIAVEEAFAPSEMVKLYMQRIQDDPKVDPGLKSAWGFFGSSTAARAVAIKSRLQDLGAARLADMDATGIDHQVISLASPGVQAFDADTAKSIAVLANDQLAEAIRLHPRRFSGLTAIAPQDPVHAAHEIERGVKLGFKGVIINSHTNDEYLDDPKFWDIFAAAEAVDMPIYLHPNTPSRQMIQPFLERGLAMAMCGFYVETGFHVLSLIVAGVFDRFPKLKMVLGHLGEALPFWLERTDYMHAASVGTGRYKNWVRLRRKPSEYLRENFYFASSGMAWAPAIDFVQRVIGEDRVMYAMDYPFQFGIEEVLPAEEAPMSDATRLKFFQTNAERIFKLDFT